MNHLDHAYTLTTERAHKRSEDYLTAAFNIVESLTEVDRRRYCAALL